MKWLKNKFMQKWEYTLLVTEKPLLEELNNMGAEGWEAWGLTEAGAYPKTDGQWRIGFKRPKE